MPGNQMKKTVAITINKFRESLKAESFEAKS